jgi:hypothetical protein
VVLTAVVRLLILQVEGAIFAAAMEYTLQVGLAVEGQQKGSWWPNLGRCNYLKFDGAAALKLLVLLWCPEKIPWTVHGLLQKARRIAHQSGGPYQVLECHLFAIDAHDCPLSA